MSYHTIPSTPVSESYRESRKSNAQQKDIKRRNLVTDLELSLPDFSKHFLFGHSCKEPVVEVQWFKRQAAQYKGAVREPDRYPPLLRILNKLSLLEFGSTCDSSNSCLVFISKYNTPLAAHAAEKHLKPDICVIRGVPEDVEDFLQRSETEESCRCKFYPT